MKKILFIVICVGFLFSSCQMGLSPSEENQTPSTTGSSGVLHQAGSYGKAVVMPDLGDLALLVKDEGYQGEFFKTNSVDSLALAIEVLVTNEAHRLNIAKANYKAATAFPMGKITSMYLNKFDKIISKKGTQKTKALQSSTV